MILSSDIKTALVLAPHPDDGEFGCGATLRRLHEEGIAVWYAAFSPCIESLPAGSAPDRLWTELTRALGHLGISPERIIRHDFAVRYFPRDRQAILETLTRLKTQLKPDLVLMPNSMDLHQDHQVIYQEGLRAFKHSRLLGYELPWNNLIFRSDFHMRVTEAQLDAKVQAVREYESQRNRIYSDRDFLIGLARVRGVQVGADFAEAFETIRWIG
ncbi:MAG: PIG-L family deacetylase [Bacteroidetes bacterium]|nr:PIG-L family deacetylase [Bacteroidota bacterium]